MRRIVRAIWFKAKSDMRRFKRRLAPSSLTDQLQANQISLIQSIDRLCQSSALAASFAAIQRFHGSLVQAFAASNENELRATIALMNQSIQQLRLTKQTAVLCKLARPEHRPMFNDDISELDTATRLRLGEKRAGQT